MNPSASGWIKKFESLNKDIFIDIQSFNDLYIVLRGNGFIYGRSDSALINLNLEHNLSQDEIEKINFLFSLYFIYTSLHRDFKFNEFVDSILNFFKKIEVFELSLWDKFIAGKDNYQQLERIIHEHIQIDQNMFLKQFSKSTTNSLLFIDVLGYQHFLNDTSNTLSYVRDVEYIVVNITNDINSFKTKKNIEEKNSIKTITNSINFQKTTTHRIDINYRRLIETKHNIIEKKYFLDIAILSIWEPIFSDDKAFNFIKALGADMNLSENVIEDSIREMVEFYDVFKETSLFKTTNYISNFYDNTSQLVIKLIKRNSKRILKEISQSKELMVLLSQSTVRDLSKEEQDKVQFQLLDILKTIPSLAIFLLPGGAILLPIFAKLLPNLMPSAFDDNKVD